MSLFVAVRVAVCVAGRVAVKGVYAAEANLWMLQSLGRGSCTPLSVAMCVAGCVAVCVAWDVAVLG